MKRLVLIACASLAVLLFPLRAVAQHAHADSPKTTLTVIKPLVVGQTTLPPGQYRFQCRTFDGRTFLIVTSASSGKEIARVPCARETLEAAVPYSDYRSIPREDGKLTLTSVRIKGELVAHRVVD